MIHRIATKAWVMFQPDGRIVVDTSFTNETAAWHMVFSSEQAIREAKEQGCRVVLTDVVLTYHQQQSKHGVPDIDTRRV